MSVTENRPPATKTGSLVDLAEYHQLIEEGIDTLKEEQVATAKAQHVESVPEEMKKVVYKPWIMVLGGLALVNLLVASYFSFTARDAEQDAAAAVKKVNQEVLAANGGAPLDPGQEFAIEQITRAPTLESHQYRREAERLEKKMSQQLERDY